MKKISSKNVLLPNTLNSNVNYSRIILELCLLFALLVLIFPNFNHGSDTKDWTNWALYIHQNGITNVYHSYTNYHPVFLYMLWLYESLAGSVEMIISNIGILKIFPLFFDFLPVLLLVIYRQKMLLSKNQYFFLLLNAAYLYNTLIWGQVDSIPAGLVLASIFVAMRRPNLAIALFVLAVGTKLQAIVFLPVLAIILLLKMNSYKKFLQYLLIATLTVFAILAPFIFTGNIDDYFRMTSQQIGFFPVVSMNAFNFWHIVSRIDPLYINDQDTWLLFSYRAWGFILFFTASAVVLYPLFIKTLEMIRKKIISPRFMEMIFLTSGIIALCFFFFNTQMHERYTHPALIFFFFYALYSNKYLLYILVSFAYFMNLEKILKYLEMSHHTLPFEPKVQAGIFLLIIIIGTYRLYKNYSLQKKMFFRLRTVLAEKKN